MHVRISTMTNDFILHWFFENKLLIIRMIIKKRILFNRGQFLFEKKNYSYICDFCSYKIYLSLDLF